MKEVNCLIGSLMHLNRIRPYLWGEKEYGKHIARNRKPYREKLFSIWLFRYSMRRIKNASICTTDLTENLLRHKIKLPIFSHIFERVLWASASVMAGEDK